MSIPSGSDHSSSYSSSTPPPPVSSKGDSEEEIELEEEEQQDALDPASPNFDPSLIQSRDPRAGNSHATGDTLDKFTRPDDKYTV